MNRKIAYTCIISALLLFVSFILLSVAWGNPTIFTIVGTGEGQQYSVIMEAQGDEIQENNIEIILFQRPDAGRINVISPNSQGRGTITLKNTSRYPMRYTVNFDCENELDVPLVFRVRDEQNNIIIGSDDIWVNEEQLESFTKDLNSGNQTQYVVEWHWDSVSDKSDTDIGKKAQDLASYTLTVSILSKPIGYITDKPFYADNANLISLILAIFLTATIATATYFAFNNRKNKF